MFSIKELRQKNISELAALVKERRSALVESSAKAALKQLKNVRAIRMIRRDIARGLTVMREKGISKI